MKFNEPKYEAWLDEATFDNCKLDRKAFGEFLAGYLASEKDGFVLNLNSSWGTGKTEFLKRLYGLFLNRNHPCIYIDAWESDFSKEPLTVVASELLTQMKALHGDVVGFDETKKAKKYLGQMLKGLAVGVSGMVTKKLIDDYSVGLAAAQQALNIETEPEEYVDQLSADYAQQVDSIKHIRESLTELAESMETKLGVTLPVVVLVDELDRCRPDYAIEMLEVIKHFFNTPNFVFVVASDTEQLCESIKNVYGSNFDSYSYLKRFFDRRTILPKPSLRQYVELKTHESKQFEEEINNEGVLIYPNIRPDEPVSEHVKKYIAGISESFGLGLRDVDQLLARFNACIRYGLKQYDSIGKIQVINAPILIMALIEFDLGLDSYTTRKTKNNRIYPTYKNKDVIIDQSLNVEQLINICMIGVVLHSYRNNSNHSAERFGYLNYTHIEKYHNQGIPRIQGIIADSVCSTITDNVREYNKNKAKIWMWNDYKKVIELSGSIE